MAKKDDHGGPARPSFVETMRTTSRIQEREPREVAIDGLQGRLDTMGRPYAERLFGASDVLSYDDRAMGRNSRRTGRGLALAAKLRILRLPLRLHLPLRLLVPLFLLLLPGLAQAELYSWVDEEGVIHLTNLRKSAPFQVYGGEQGEGFGGQTPVIQALSTGEKRVFYPVDVTRFDELFMRAAQHYRLPFAFVKAVAKVESNFNPFAVSPKQAKGLMQLIDDTARDLRVEDPFDPEQNVFAGVRYLRMLANRFEGHLALTAAAYNAGPERVQRLGRVPTIPETQQYVRRVLTMYRHYRRAE